MLTAPPLELRQYFFPYVEVGADAEYEPTEDTSEPNVEIKTSVARDEKNHAFQVVVEILIEPENEKSRVPYSIHLVTVGLFTLKEDFPEKEKLLRITGASMLYSAAREFIITITSRGPWPPVIVPTVSFLPKEEKEPAES
jgi:preprotein translocase subunit SecB